MKRISFSLQKTKFPPDWVQRRGGTQERGLFSDTTGELSSAVAVIDSWGIVKKREKTEEIKDVGQVEQRSEAKMMSGEIVGGRRICSAWKKR